MRRRRMGIRTMSSRKNRCGIRSGIGVGRMGVDEKEKYYS